LAGISEVKPIYEYDAKTPRNTGNENQVANLLRFSLNLESAESTILLALSSSVTNVRLRIVASRLFMEKKFEKIELNQ
jgi:hypothetical protein